MTTHNHANTAARSAGHAPMEVLTAAEADAIVGGGLLGDIWDGLKGAAKRVKQAVQYPFEKLKEWLDKIPRPFPRLPGPDRF